MSRVRLVVGPNRLDVSFLDLVGGKCSATIADKDSASDFLIEHETHLGLDPSNDIKVGNIDNIVAVKLLKLVDRLRADLSTKSLDNLFYLLIALDVTTSACFVGGDINSHGLDLAERGLMNRRENAGNPLHTTRDRLRNGINSLDLREQGLDVGDTVREAGITKRPVTAGLRLREDGLHVIVGKNVASFVVRLENIEFHGFSFCIGMFDFAFVDKCPNNSVYSFLLLIVEGVENFFGVLDRFAFSSQRTDNTVHNFFLVITHGIEYLANSFLVGVLDFVFFV